jgi:hypothetical protein
MVTAKAAGVRKLSSKLRFVLQDFSFLDIDLVAGRNIFHLTTAVKTCDLENLTKKIEVFKRVTSGVKRAKLYYIREKAPKEIDKIYSRTNRREQNKKK